MIDSPQVWGGAENQQPNQVMHRQKSFCCIWLSQEQYFKLTAGCVPRADVVFPLGGMRKEQVRRLAIERGIPSALRQSSAGICFIGTHFGCSMKKGFWQCQKLLRKLKLEPISYIATSVISFAWTCCERRWRWKCPHTTL